MTTITALPTPPSRADSTNFSTRGDAFLGALPTFVTEANAVGSEATAAAAAAAASASAAAASQSTASTAAAAVAAQSPVANAAAAAASAAAAAASAAAAAQTSGAVAATTLSYSSTLTGGTGIVNLGAGQFYKDASGKVGIGTTSPEAKLEVSNPTASNNTVIAEVLSTNRSYSTSNNGLSLIATASNGTLGTHDFGALTFNEAPNSNGFSAYMNMYLGGLSSGYGNGSRFLQAYTSTGVGVDYVTLWTGSSERMRIDANGNATVSTAALLGYGTGSGGTVTQATSKSTAVTLNKPTGQITMNNAALAAGATVAFVCSNSLVTTTDCIISTINANTSNPENYTVSERASAGLIVFRLTNVSGSSLSDVVQFNFAVIKGSLT